MKYDIIGSFLAPDEFLTAKAQYEANAISETAFEAAQSGTIRLIADKQIEAGLKEVTSGEVRRNYWDKDFFFALNGITRERHECGRIYQDEAAFTDLIRFTGPIAYNPLHPIFEDFTKLKDYVGNRAECRQTLPSPTNLYLEILDMSNGHPEKIYPSPDTLLEDITSTYRLTIKHLYELGCRHVQLDDADCGHMSNPEFENRLVQGGIDLNKLHQQTIKLINDSISDLPEDMHTSIFISSGTTIIPNWEAHDTPDHFMPKLLVGINVDTYYMPFELEHPKHMEILRFIPQGREVVLGLIDAHTPIPDNKEAVKHTVQSALQYIPAEKLAISPRTGFKLSSYATRGLTFEDQWRKLKLLSEIAAEL